MVETRRRWTMVDDTVRRIACSEAAGAEPAGKQAAAGACGERPIVAARPPAVGLFGALPVYQTRSGQSSDTCESEAVSSTTRRT